MVLTEPNLFRCPTQRPGALPTSVDLVACICQARFLNPHVSFLATQSTDQLHESVVLKTLVDMDVSENPFLGRSPSANPGRSTKHERYQLCMAIKCVTSRLSSYVMTHFGQTTTSDCTKIMHDPHKMGTRVSALAWVTTFRIP